MQEPMRNLKTKNHRARGEVARKPRFLLVCPCSGIFAPVDEFCAIEFDKGLTLILGVCVIVSPILFVLGS